MTAVADAGAKRPVWLHAFNWLLEQVLHMLPTVIFFFVGFNKANTVETISDSGSPANIELVGVLHQLAAGAVAHA